MTLPEQAAIVRDLERLCGAMDRFGRDIGEIKSSLAVLVERSTRTEQDVRDLRGDMEEGLRKIREEEVKPLRAEVERVKRAKWITIGAALAAGGTGSAVVQQALGG